MKKKVIIFLIAQLLCYSIVAQNKQVCSIGSPTFKDWKGAKNTKSDQASVAFNQTLSFTYPDAKRYAKGFRKINNDVADWSEFEGIQFEVFIDEDQTVQFDITLKVPDIDA